MGNWEILLIVSVLLVLFLGRQMSDIGRDFITNATSRRDVWRAVIGIFAVIVLGLLYVAYHAR